MGNSNIPLLIKEDKTLWGWGTNSYGLLGPISWNISSKINFMNKLSEANSWLKVTAGINFVIGIQEDGTIWSAGYNNYGQLGQGDTVTRTDITQIGTDNDWKEVSAGTNHVLAIKKDGSLWAWGWASGGILGNDQTADQYVPIKIGSENDWEYVSAGYRFSTGLKKDGTLWSWGNNSAGQLGVENISQANVPVKVKVDFKWKRIDAGYETVIGIAEDNSLWGWGQNNSGEVGDGTTEKKITPVQINNSGDWKEISAGRLFNLALKEDGSLYAWGKNNKRQYGSNNITEYNVPTLIDNGTWRSMLAYYDSSLFVDTKGELWCAGDNPLSMTGDLTILDINYETKFEKISVGIDGIFVLAKTAEGKIYGWGRNAYGQLGDGTLETKFYPNPISSESLWRDISAGGYHSLAIRDDGTLWSWGYNPSGQLGIGGTVNQSTPVQVGIDTDWKMISAGSMHSLALKEDGSLWVWGANSAGQLGTGDTTSRETPTKIMESFTWNEVASGSYHSMAIDSNGDLYSWGQYTYGKLGVGTQNTNVLSPRLVSNSSGVKWLKAGGSSQNSYGIRVDGSLWIWGCGNQGVTSTNSSVDRLAPSMVGTDYDWVDCSISYYHAAAIKEDGSLWTWGNNLNGQLGIGETVSRVWRLPMKIMESGAVAVSLGNQFSLTSDGTSYHGTGDNSDGQLGRGTRVASNIFVEVGKTAIYTKSLAEEVKRYLKKYLVFDRGVIKKYNLLDAEKWEVVEGELSEDLLIQHGIDYLSDIPESGWWELDDEFEILTYSEDPNKTTEHLSMSYNDPGEVQYDLDFIALANDELALPVNDISINGRIQSIDLNADGVMIILSADSSGSWWSFKDNSWRETFATVESVRESGMSRDELFKIPSEELDLFTSETRKIRLAYLLIEESFSRKSFVEDITILYKPSSAGTPIMQTASVEYNAITIEGTLQDLEKINYVNMAKLQFKSASFMKSEKYSLHNLVIDTFEDLTGVNLEETTAIFDESLAEFTGPGVVVLLEEVVAEKKNLLITAGYEGDILLEYSLDGGSIWRAVDVDALVDISTETGNNLSIRATLIEGSKLSGVAFAWM